MNVKPFAVAAALLAAACSAEAGTSSPAPPPAPVACVAYDVRISPALPPAWIEGTTRAVQRWSEALGPSFVYTIRVTSAADAAADDCTVNAILGPVPPHAWAVTGRLPAAPGALVKSDVVVSGRRSEAPGLYSDEDVAYASMLHEFGHVLGLEHNEDRHDRAVMWPAVSVPGRLGCTDVQRACVLWGCQPPPCSYGTWLDS